MTRIGFSTSHNHRQFWENSGQPTFCTSLGQFWKNCINQIFTPFSSQFWDENISVDLTTVFTSNFPPSPFSLYIKTNVFVFTFIFTLPPPIFTHSKHILSSFRFSYYHSMSHQVNFHEKDH